MSPRLRIRKPAGRSQPWTGVADPPLIEAIKMAGLDSVEGAFAYEGGPSMGGASGLCRSSLLWLSDNIGRTHQLHLKRYVHGGVRHKLGRLVRGKSGMSEAYVEFANILLARQSGVPTANAIIAGQESQSIGTGRSYLIVTAAPGEALERCAEGFLARAAKDEKAAGLFTLKLGQLVGAFHRTGMVHRDLSASNIFLHERGSEFDLYLVDLAKAFSPKLGRFGWLVADLAALKHSMPPQWVERWWGQFFSVWRRAIGDLPSRADESAWQRAIDRRAKRIRRHRAGKAPGDSVLEIR